MCRILDGLTVGTLPGGWVLNGNIDPAIRRPALVLSTVDHYGHLAEIGGTEAEWLGRHLRRIDGIARKVLGAQRLHVQLLNEAGHVHFHLVPRYPDDDRSVFALALLRVDAPAGAPDSASAARSVLAELT
ncbi:diadenosine tetraphosphate (Ap4A) HIT family hydrolase [Herbihabitans rhizosphaerae]|uniref:Diadenosine tetraphosphate (Ap4A) HIT family hydrolase n=1 Tax=Herbihabitans rhizosphaerae TaxID=1872711 RepID=A0A4Q7KE02_9PSEU|nr:diadenosine tetraphosphate (Ap4A) HIT family hydrolase [Herbihabitans rhizosphaerae]